MIMRSMDYTQMVPLLLFQRRIMVELDQGQQELLHGQMEAVVLVFREIIYI